MKLTCTWSPEQVSNFITFHYLFWPFPLLPRVSSIDSVQNSLMEARNRLEERICQSRLTDFWFMFNLLGNVTIGNYHFGTLGRQKQTKKTHRAAVQIRRQATGKRPGAPNGQFVPGFRWHYGTPTVCPLSVFHIAHKTRKHLEKSDMRGI